MILPVRLFTDPILHKFCIPVTNFIDASALAQDMVESMFHYKGVGLAASQVGNNTQLCVMWLENKTKILCVANPKIICYNKETSVMSEGCLSVPNLSINMQRPTWVEFEYQKLNGEKDKMRLEGFDCRIFFHEFEHLQGRLITDCLQRII